LSLSCTLYIVPIGPQYNHLIQPPIICNVYHTSRFCDPTTTSSSPRSPWEDRLCSCGSFVDLQFFFVFMLFIQHVMQQHQVQSFLFFSSKSSQGRSKSGSCPLPLVTPPTQNHLHPLRSVHCRSIFRPPLCPSLIPPGFIICPHLSVRAGPLHASTVA
jgi:hypothetical protein